MNIFVSYQYIGKVNTRIYEGFGNCTIPCKLPKTAEDLEEFKNQVKADAKQFNGMKEITCTVLYYREM